MPAPDSNMGRLYGLLAVLLAVLARPTSAKGPIHLPKDTPTVWIVQLNDVPAASYDGSKSGFKATRPAAGDKLDSTGEDVTRYMAFLSSKSTRVLALAGVEPANIRKQFGLTFPGFAVNNLDSRQVAALKSNPDVAAIHAARISLDGDSAYKTGTRDSSTLRRRVDAMRSGRLTSSAGDAAADAAAFMWGGSRRSLLNMDRSAPAVSSELALGSSHLFDLQMEKLWEEVGGFSQAGENQVIGFLGDGIWPEHPAFSDRENASTSGRITYKPLPRKAFRGECEAGEQFNKTNCNQKLVACRSLNNYQLAGVLAGVEEGSDYLSCRDYYGQGTQMTGLAAGNGLLPNDITPAGKFSGAAPRARVAVYKYAWDGARTDLDALDGLEQAVKDGVDILQIFFFYVPDANPVDGTLQPFTVASLHAAAAGVFLSTALVPSYLSQFGAQAEPGATPWAIFTAATKQSRIARASATFGNGVTVTGLGWGRESVGPVPLIYAGLLATDQLSAGRAATCNFGLNASLAAGKIVVCEGGGYSFFQGLAVQAAEAVGMIVLSPFEDSTYDTIPSLKMTPADSATGDAVRSYSREAGATAILSAAVLSNSRVVPVMAAGNERGTIADYLDILKPDTAAPGDELMAPTSPNDFVFNSFRNYDIVSGAWLSASIVSGVAALLRQHYPRWSPAAIKSAIMTTGRTTDINGNAFGDPLDFGGGQVDPTRVANPGLILDAGIADWTRYLCGIGAYNLEAACPECVKDISRCVPSNLNEPSITIGRLTKSRTVVRTVTSVLGAAATFSAAYSGSQGLQVTITPSSFTLPPGRSRQLSITMTHVSGPLGEHQFGAVTITSSAATTTRLPVVAKPESFQVAPRVVFTNRPAAFTLPVFTASAGRLSATTSGLLPATVTKLSVNKSYCGAFEPKVTPFTAAATFTVPEGAEHAIFAVLKSDYVTASPRGADFDMYVYDSDGKRVFQSARTPEYDEIVTQGRSPKPGVYTVYVTACSFVDGPTEVKLYSWIVTDGPGGNAAVPNGIVSPLQAGVDTKPGVPVAARFRLSGMDPAQKYLAAVRYKQQPLAEAGTAETPETLVYLL